MIKEIFLSMGREITDEQEKKFSRYAELIKEYNEKINLTAITDPRDMAIKHFADSVSGESFFCANAEVCDVGSGAGFPAIPIMIVRPDLGFTLLDSLQKRVSFLKTAIAELGLKAEIIHIRAEDAGRGEFRERFDYATARAVAPLNILCEYVLPLVKCGGEFIAYKGPDVAAEIDGAKNAIKLLGGELKEVRELTLPDGSSRSLVSIRKAVSTPKRYPRGQNKPRLSPL